VAVTGLGCVSAAGANLTQCLETLFKTGCLPGPPSRFCSDHPQVHPVFEVPDAWLPDDTDGSDGLLRTSRLALAAAAQALADAGWTAKGLHRLKVGVCLGTTVGSSLNNEPFYRQYRIGQHPDMSAIKAYLINSPAAVLARGYGLAGPCQTVVNACSSGTDAIGLAAEWLRSGVCDVVLAGGADELSRVAYNGFISLMITDTQPARPFDRARKGLNLGEGAAVLVLESEAIRHHRGQRARAFVLGYGAACDAYHLTAPSPTGEGLRRALTEAIANSGKSFADLAFINAHGTATPDNDRVETRVLGELTPQVPFLSTKGATGHALGAAGAIEAAFTIGCLEMGQVPASIGFCVSDDGALVQPLAQPRAFTKTMAASQSLAFGGNNAVLILGKGEVG
jgi:3-oxoacyl-[acyl-carrier-protein] synthase-1/3-oxoacyl-[acyl-carrier-protein] synthase II